MGGLSEPNGPGGPGVPGELGTGGTEDGGGARASTVTSLRKEILMMR